jgi:hypothetical protein
MQLLIYSNLRSVFFGEHLCAYICFAVLCTLIPETNRTCDKRLSVGIEGYSMSNLFLVKHGSVPIVT